MNLRASIPWILRSHVLSAGWINSSWLREKPLTSAPPSGRLHLTHKRHLGQGNLSWGIGGDLAMKWTFYATNMGCDSYQLTWTVISIGKWILLTTNMVMAHHGSKLHCCYSHILTGFTGLIARHLSESCYWWTVGHRIVWTWRHGDPMAKTQ